ncbi:MAG: hypothetical protein KDJ16_11625 [Hyphomicrobiales bacterium]|nr:hypothetical protein [Hyphomicrobiales bacterium]
MAVVVSILTLISYQNQIDTAYKNILKEIKTAILFATSPLKAPTTRELEYVGRRLVLEGVVVGGYIVDESDRLVGKFGNNLPDAEYIAEVNQSTNRQTADGRFIDMRYSGIPSGFAYDFVVRVDRRQNHDAALIGVLKNTTAGIIGVALGLALFFAAFIYLAVRPLARLRDGVINAISDIENADKHLLDCQRRDEIGEVTNSINMLISAASSSRREETEAFGKFMEESDIPIIKLVDGRTVDYANDAANEFFGIQSLDEFRDHGWPAVTGSNGAGDRFIGEYVDEGKKSRLVTVRTNFGARQVKLVIAEHQAAHSSHRSTMLIMFDIYRFVRAVNRHKADAENAIEERRSAEKMAAFKAFQLDGLIRYIERIANSKAASDDNPKSGTEFTLLPDRCIQSWHTAAREEGIVSGPLEYDILPGIGVPPSRFKAAVDAIMVYLITAAGSPGVQIAVATTISDETIEYKFGGKRPLLADNLQTPLLEHLEKSVRLAVADCGGKVIEIADYELTMFVNVSLPGIPEEADIPDDVDIPEETEDAA